MGIAFAHHIAAAGLDRGMQPLVGWRAADEQEAGPAPRGIRPRQPLAEIAIKRGGVAKIRAAKYSIHHAAANPARALAYLHRPEKQFPPPIALADGAG